MRHFSVAAAALLLFLPSVAASAGPSWSKATTTSVIAGVTSKSTFKIQAVVMLPTQCDAARIRTQSITTGLHRTFVVEQLVSTSPCAQKTTYTCTVQSPTFQLPIPHKFEVDSKGKTEEVTLGVEAPTAMPPMCHKG